MNKSEQINELALALSKAQGELEAVKFDSTNPFYGSKYASLGALIQTAKHVLSKNGLSVIQPASSNWLDERLFVSVETTLMHSSGQWISSTLSIAVDEGEKNMIQNLGKIITYCRRYSLASMLSMYADEDTDGNQEEQIQETKSGSAEKKPQAIYDPLAVKAFIQKKAKLLSPASEKQVQLVQRKFQELIEDEDERHQVILFLTGAEHVKNADPTVVNSILKWMRLDENYQLSAEAEEELAGIRAYLAAEEE